MMRRSFKATALSAHPPPPHSTPKACSRIRPCFRVQARCLLYTVFFPRVRARLHSAQDSWTHYSELWNVCTHVPSDFIPGYEHVCTRFLNPQFRTMNVYTLSLGFHLRKWPWSTGMNTFFISVGSRKKTLFCGEREIPLKWPWSTPPSTP